MRRFFASVLAAILGLGLALPPEAHAANLVPVKNIPIPVPVKSGGPTRNGTEHGLYPLRPHHQPHLSHRRREQIG